MERQVKGVYMVSIKSLLSAYTGRIYIYLATADIGKRFLQDAEKEGFMFRDGVKPTQREADSIFAINDDMTINYVGLVGHIAYQAADKIGNKPLIKIDYRDIMWRAEWKTAHTGIYKKAGQPINVNCPPVCYSASSSRLYL